MTDIRQLINLVEGAQVAVRTEASINESPSMPVPALGSIFEFGGKRFSVTGYMQEARLGFGRRNETLVACHPHQASWVIGGGGAGTFAPLSDITVIEKPTLSPEENNKLQVQSADLIQKKYSVRLPQR